MPSESSGGILDASNHGFVILTNSPTTILDTSKAELQPHQQVTIIIELDETLKSGRDAQLKITTEKGTTFIGTVIAGQQSG